MGLLDILIGLVVTLALLFFFWGLAIFIFNAGDDDARKKGRAVMFWGIVALFVIVAVWGLVALLNQILLGGAEVEDPGVPGITGPGAEGGVDLGDDPLGGGTDGPFDPADQVGGAPPPGLGSPPAFGGP
ncbi:hypothetical protein GVX82_03900 [Patescibacteria group bacterium]|nr:hypothetical protein [Patescibacteria group bacterium]